MSNSISTASNEQKLGVQEVTRAVAQLSQVNSQNAAASSQAASAAESLAAQSLQLEELVQQLSRAVNGSAAATAAAPAPRAQARKVISFSEHKPAKKVVEPGAELAPMKFAVGDAVPSNDDPRFQDV